MPSNCIFKLNKTNVTYFCGETISGTITLTTSSDKNTRGISIIFVGEGKVQWTEHHSRNKIGGGRQPSTTLYRSHETYISNCTTVHGNGILPAGTHTFNFNILLPMECPTSCEGKYGHVRYEISLRINRYYRFDNVFKRPVTVIKSIDLNFNPAYKLPIQLETIKKLGFWPVSGGTIKFTLNIPCSAYVCGQNVRYIVNISNLSMKDTEGYLIQFVKKITFRAKYPRHKNRNFETVLLSKNVEEKCLRLTNRVIEGEFFLPATPPSSEISSIICVEYICKATLRLSGWSFNPTLEVPIVVGTVPIMESLSISRNQQLATAPDMPKGDDLDVENNLPPNYNNIKPPTYAETTRRSSPFTDTDDDGMNSIKDFNPLYPLYNFSHTPN